MTALLREIIQQMKAVPEYLIAMQGALSILAMALPLYLGLRYFVYRRKIALSVGATLHFFGAFILFAGLAFLLASPLSRYLPSPVITTYLFFTCLSAAFGAVSLIDVFLIRYYLIQIKRVYISPPLRVGVKLILFVIALLPILRYILDFNPLALVAIPTIATAGIALALQDTLKTFIAGIGLGQIIRLGEWISFNGREGQVVDINWARTVIEAIDGQRIFIPNSLLQTGMFSNLTAGNPANLVVLKIGVSYDTVPAHVKSILETAVVGVPNTVSSPPPQAVLMEFAESSVVYGLYFWISDFKVKLKVQDEVASRIWYAVKREGISIPFPTRTVQLDRRWDHARRERMRVQQELKRWSLAEAFYTEELEDLAQSTRSRLYGTGEVIVRQGDPGQSLFTIVEGEVEVVVGQESEHPVATLGAHDVFGEMSLLTGAPRSATVRAKTPVEVLEIDKPGMQRQIAKRPELSDRLANLLTSRQAALAKGQKTQEPNPKAQTSESPETLSRTIRHFFGLA